MKKAVVLALAAIMVLGVAGAAMAGDSGPIAGSGSPLAATGTVAVKANVNPKLTLTLATTDGSGTTLLLDWGTIDPDVGTSVTKDVDITVDSNRQFDLAVTEDFSGFSGSGITVANTLAAGEDNIKQGKGVERTDTVSLSAPSGDWWQVVPGTYSGSIVYTVTQD